MGMEVPGDGLLMGCWLVRPMIEILTILRITAQFISISDVER